MRRRAAPLALGWVAAAFLVATLAFVAGVRIEPRMSAGSTTGLTTAADAVHDATTVSLAPTKVAGLRPVLLVALVAAAVAIVLGRRTTWLVREADVARQPAAVLRATDPRAPPTRTR